MPRCRSISFVLFAASDSGDDEMALSRTVGIVFDTVRAGAVRDDRVRRELLVHVRAAAVEIESVVARDDAVLFQNPIFEPARLAADEAQVLLHVIVVDRRVRQKRSR